MKVKTNLHPSELELIGKGLQALAKSQRNKKYPTENKAERDILLAVDSAFDDMINSFSEEVSSVLMENDDE